MAYFIWDEYSVMASKSAIQRALKKKKWSKKQVYIASVTETYLIWVDEELLTRRHKNGLQSGMKSLGMLG